MSFLIFLGTERKNKGKAYQATDNHKTEGRTAAAAAAQGGSFPVSFSLLLLSFVSICAFLGGHSHSLSLIDWTHYWDDGKKGRKKTRP